MDMTEKQAMYDRIKGALYGEAVGDCLGAPVEFLSAEVIKRKFGMVTDFLGGGHLHLAPGVGTDDTAMTLAVAEGLMKTGANDDPVEKIGCEFVKWFTGYPVGIGGTCYQSIDGASNGGRIACPSREMWMAASKLTDVILQGRSGGNGTLMRTVPVALLLKGDNRDRVAWDVSAMTHYDPDAAEACVLYCRIIEKLIIGYDLYTALESVLSGTEYSYPVETPIPSGYVKDSFKTALWGLKSTQNFEDCLIRIVNLGGDSDTTGAIAGGIAGAVYGYSGIPERWKNALDDKLKDRMEPCITKAAEVWECRG